MNSLREPVLKQMVESLNLPIGSRGLDIGCGIGAQSILLSVAVGEEGSITGLDQDPEILDYAKSLISRANLGNRVDLRLGDMNHLPFDENYFDWVWSVDCVGYPTGNHRQLLAEINRVLKPGGQVFLAAWSSQQLLPGYSLLEANLNAHLSAYKPIFQGQDPDNCFMCISHSMELLGIHEVVARTFVGDIKAPLSADQRKAVISLIDMLWVPSQSGLTKEDCNIFEYICKPNSPGFIPDNSNYYGFFTYTLFSGRKKK